MFGDRYRNMFGDRYRNMFGDRYRNMFGDRYRNMFGDRYRNMFIEDSRRMRCRSRRISRAISEPPDCSPVVQESEHMQPGGWEIESPTFPAKISRDLRRAGPPSGRSGKRGESSSFVTEPFFEVL